MKNPISFYYPFESFLFYPPSSLALRNQSSHFFYRRQADREKERDKEFLLKTREEFGRMEFLYILSEERKNEKNSDIRV
jgi:hypothetical protein|tara:strand:+ start:658 stop:894 length:237 start_codon:yes stop_codon:yes gene_type:complete